MCADCLPHSLLPSWKLCRRYFPNVANYRSFLKISYQLIRHVHQTLPIVLFHYFAFYYCYLLCHQASNWDLKIPFHSQTVVLRVRIWWKVFWLLFSRLWLNNWQHHWRAKGSFIAWVLSVSVHHSKKGMRWENEETAAVHCSKQRMQAGTRVKYSSQSLCSYWSDSGQCHKLRSRCFNPWA